MTLIDEEVLSGQHFHNPSTTDIAQIAGSIDGPGEDCGRDYQGRVGDVRIYDRALSLPEMNALLTEVQNP